MQKRDHFPEAFLMVEPEFDVICKENARKQSAHGTDAGPTESLESPPETHTASLFV